MLHCGVEDEYDSDEGFVEHKIELGDEDLKEIIREYLERHAEFDFDEVEVVNRRDFWEAKGFSGLDHRLGQCTAVLVNDGPIP